MFLRRSWIMIGLFLVLALPALAEEHVKASGSADYERRMDYYFELDQEKDLKLTLSCIENGSRQGNFRVYFYERSPRGGWRQLDEFRLLFRDTQQEITGNISLPAGDYKITLTARWMDYSFLLEDAPEEQE